MDTKAAIYARRSQEEEGDQASTIETQIADGRAYATERGWTVAEEHVDRGVGAFREDTRRKRLGFDQLIADMEAGRVSEVIVWRHDRLLRDPEDHARLLGACRRVGLERIRVVQETDLDPRDAIGWMRTVMAAEESRAKSQRILRAMRDRAERGLPHLGGDRPFGYTPVSRGRADRTLKVKPDEAKVIREVVSRVLRDESLRSICLDLTERGIKTPAVERKRRCRNRDCRAEAPRDADVCPRCGAEVPPPPTGAWRKNTLHRLLTSPTVAGLRGHNGQLHPGNWKGIISRERWEAVRKRLEDPPKKAYDNAARGHTYLIPTRMAVCGKCGKPLVKRVGRYTCMKGGSYHGCGGVGRNAAHVDRFVEGVVLRVLDGDALSRAMRERSADDEQLTAVLEETDELRRRLDDLEEDAALAGVGDRAKLSERQYRARRRALERELQVLDRRRSELARDAVAAEFPTDGRALRRTWKKANLDQRQAILRLLLREEGGVRILPTDKRGRGFDPNAVELRWVNGEAWSFDDLLARATDGDAPDDDPGTPAGSDDHAAHAAASRTMQRLGPTEKDPAVLGPIAEAVAEMARKEAAKP